MPTLFTMTIDTEEEWDWTGDWPVQGLSVSNIAGLPRFQEVCQRWGVAPTYFVDHAVLSDDAARAVILELARRDQVEIGMHIHPWNTPPIQGNGRVRARDTFLHNLPDDVIDAKLNTVYQSFAECGLQPTSFRGGRYSTGGRIQEFLREKGFIADASFCPYSSWPDDGAPDHRQRDLTPVRRAPRGEGEAALWEIPLTLAFTRQPFAMWRRVFETIETSWLSKLRLIGIAQRLGIVRKVWLNFEHQPGREMLPFLRTLARLDLPCICFTVHSSSLMAGKNHLYTATAEDERRLFESLDLVFSYLSKSPQFEPATVTQVAQKLESQHHACSRN